MLERDIHIENMKKTIYAVLIYVPSSQKNNWHDQCPKRGKKLQDKAYGDENVYSCWKWPTSSTCVSSYI